MSRLIDGLLKPKVKWSQYLLKSLRPHIVPVDWSYRKPHKKSQLLGIYMPDVVKEQVKVEVIVDTSGSVGGQEMKEFLSEIVGIAQCFPYCEIGVTFVDAKVQNRYVVENGDIPKILSMVPRGGGGTRLEAGLERLKEDGADVPVVCILTDGCDSYSHNEKDFPFEVVWVISKNGQTRQPYGTIIKMDN